MLFSAIGGSALVVPALTLGGAPAESLEEALDRTVRSLEVLAGVQADLQQGEAEAIALARRFTQPPDDALPAPERQARLEALEREVGELRLELDLLDALAPPDGGPGEAPAPGPRTARPPAAGGAAAMTTTGLDPQMLATLARGTPQPISRVESRPAVPADRPALEPEGFAADPLRLGRLYYRAGRFQEAHDALSKLRHEPTALYWSARSLEKLGRNAEAAAAYEKVAALPDDPRLARRAAEDLEFLSWKMSFEEELAEGEERQP